MSQLNRFVSWYFETVDVGSAQGPTVRLDQDYRPIALRLTLKKAPLKASTFIQINADGVSLSLSNASVDPGGTYRVFHDMFPGVRVLKGQTLSCDVASVPAGGYPGGGLLVELELEPRGNYDDVAARQGG